MCGGAAKNATPLRSVMKAVGLDYHPEAPDRKKPEMAKPSQQTKSADERAARAAAMKQSQQSGYESTLITGADEELGASDTTTKKKTLIA